MAGIGLTPVAPFSTGLTSERHRMQLDLASGGHRFTERQQAGLKSLRQHPLHGSVAGAQAALRLKLADPAERLAEHPPRFAARVSADLKAMVRRCLDEQERLGSFRPRRIHLASRRLGAILRSWIIRNAGRHVAWIARARLWEHGSGGD